MKKILVYKLEDTPFESLLRKLAEEQNVLYIQVDKTELRNELRELLRIPVAGTDADAVFSPAPDVWIHRRDMVEPLLLLYGFSNEEMEEFFDGMKRYGIPRIRLTAMATAHNLRWSFRALYQELRTEADSMARA